MVFAMTPPDDPDVEAARRARAEIESLRDAVRKHEDAARRDTAAIAQHLLQARSGKLELASRIASILVALATICAVFVATGQLRQVRTADRLAFISETFRPVWKSLTAFTQTNATNAFRDDEKAPPADAVAALENLIFEVVLTHRSLELAEDPTLADEFDKVLLAVCQTLNQPEYDGLFRYLGKNAFFNSMPAGSNQQPTALREKLTACLTQEQKQAMSTAAG